MNQLNQTEQGVLDIFQSDELLISLPLNDEQCNLIKKSLKQYQAGTSYPIEAVFNVDTSNENRLIAVPTHFTLIEYDPRKKQTSALAIRELLVEKRSSDPEAWAITNMGAVLARDGFWEYEPTSSSRDEDFFKRCRYDSAEIAIQFAQDHMKLYPSGQKPQEDRKEMFGV